MKSKILLVDDEESVLAQMRLIFEHDYDALTSGNEEEAIRVFRDKKPAVVISDLSLIPHDPSDLGGMRLLERILSEAPATRVIIVTGNNQQTNALRAIQLGASDYYFKPIRIDDLKVMVQRALHLQVLQQKLYNTYSRSGEGLMDAIGKAKALGDIPGLIERVAASNIPVLICGEISTGNEVVARAIHQRSERKNNPFVVVNCGATRESLLERELFGYEEGAFTGAHAQKRGKFELANTGTLFLDEIGELAPTLQVKLLRFLQDRKIERVGGTQTLELDVRFLAATNRDLIKDLESHSFRKDLYYRLKVVPLELPPLRERKEDIIPLAQHSMQKHCREHRTAPKTLSPQSEGALLMHSWPGNVRELENLISRSVVLNPHSVLKPSDLGLALDPVPTDVNLKLAKKAIEIDFVKRALSRNKGIVSRAARELGISRVHLYDLIQKYSIRIQEFKLQRSNRNHKSQLDRREVV